VVLYSLTCQAVSLVNDLLPEEKKYVRGAVEKLGYGPERYIFLKVGPYWRFSIR
jgi:hypothetical protein